MFNEISIRKTPVTILLKLIAVQFLILFIYLLIYAIQSIADISGLEGYHFLSTTLFRVFLASVLEVFFAFLIFLSWFREYYLIKPNEITYYKGVFKLRKRGYKIEGKGLSFEDEFTIFGKFFQFQNLRIYLDSLEKPLEIDAISTNSANIIKNGLKPEKEMLNYGNLLKLPVGEIVKLSENFQIEFKATMRFDLKVKSLNRDLEKSVLKNLAAFANSSGGILVIGVSDNHEITGIEKDYPTIKRPDSDGYENYLNQLLIKTFGADSRRLFDVKFEVIDGLTIALIYTKPSSSPVYVTLNGKQDLYIRTGNSTTSLDVKEAVGYYQEHFVSRG